LELYRCARCYLVQLLDVVPAEKIFDDYLYLSSSSRALVRHYAALAGDLAVRYDLKPGDLVVDIGCNDGILLHGYPVQGLVRVGVEPSKVADVAKGSGLEVIRGFFSSDVARQILVAHGPAKVVTATNVFAHVDEIGDFADGLPALLGSSGVFVIEAPYLLDMFEQALFDTVYHEHLCYLALTPVVPFLARHGLEVFDVQRVPFGASGPALRIFVQPAGAGRRRSEAVTEMLDAESRWGIAGLDRYADFARRVEAVRSGLCSLLGELHASGATIAAYGAPAKGNTLLNYAGLTSAIIKYIADTNSWKQGLLTPGSHIPIVSEEDLLAKMPDYALLLSWNYLEFFLEHSEYIRKGGRFIVPLPSPAIRPGPRAV
jgi:hypothetical protein